VKGGLRTAGLTALALLASSACLIAPLAVGAAGALSLARSG
jgi:hypothetical protein